MPLSAILINKIISFSPDSLSKGFPAFGFTFDHFSIGILFWFDIFIYLFGAKIQTFFKYFYFFNILKKINDKISGDAILLQRNIYFCLFIGLRTFK